MTTCLLRRSGKKSLRAQVLAMMRYTRYWRPTQGNCWPSWGSLPFLRPNSSLGFADPEDLGPALRADTLSGGTAVLQRNLLWIRYLPFVSALKAVSFHVVYPQTFRCAPNVKIGCYENR